MAKRRDSISRDDLIKIFGGRREFNEAKRRASDSLQGEIGILCDLSSGAKVVMTPSGPRNSTYHLESDDPETMRRTKALIAKGRHLTLVPITRPVPDPDTIDIARTSAAPEATEPNNSNKDAGGGTGAESPTVAAAS